MFLVAWGSAFFGAANFESSLLSSFRPPEFLLFFSLYLLSSWVHWKRLLIYKKNGGVGWGGGGCLTFLARQYCTGLTRSHALKFFFPLEEEEIDGIFF